MPALRFSRHEVTRLNQERAVSLALGFFPRLYYFVPPIEPVNVRLLPDRIEEDGPTTIEIKEPLDAILWLLEALAQDEKDSTDVCCFQPELYNLIHRLTGWDRSKFTDELNKLLDTGIIDSSRRSDGDRRSNKLTLTPKGKAVLRKIKEQRIEVINFLFEGQPSPQLEMMVFALEKMANSMWKKMRSYKIPKKPPASPRASKTRARKR